MGKLRHMEAEMVEVAVAQRLACRPQSGHRLSQTGAKLTQSHVVGDSGPLNLPLIFWGPPEKILLSRYDVFTTFLMRGKLALEERKRNLMSLQEVTRCPRT